MPVGDVYKFTMLFSHTSGTFTQVAQNQYYYLVNALTGPDPAPGDVRTVLRDTLVPTMTPLYTGLVSFRGAEVRRVWPLPVSLPNGFPEFIAGTFAPGEVMPGQVCGVITKRTPLGGRQFRGRIYTPFPPEAAGVAFQGPDAAYQALMQDHADVMDDPVTLIAGATAVTFQPVLFHPLNVPLPTFLQNCVARSRWGTQRSRGGYGAPNIIPTFE